MTEMSGCFLTSRVVCANSIANVRQPLSAESRTVGPGADPASRTLRSTRRGFRSRSGTGVATTAVWEGQPEGLFLFPRRTSTRLCGWTPVAPLHQTGGDLLASRRSRGESARRPTRPTSRLCRTRWTALRRGVRQGPPETLWNTLALESSQDHGLGQDDDEGDDALSVHRRWTWIWARSRSGYFLSADADNRTYYLFAPQAPRIPTRLILSHLPA